VFKLDKVFFFRGKSKKQKTWLYGGLLTNFVKLEEDRNSLIGNDEVTLIIDYEFLSKNDFNKWEDMEIFVDDFIIDEKTLGIYTLINDDERYGIYTGDIINFEIDVFGDIKKYTETVKFEKGRFIAGMFVINEDFKKDCKKLLVMGNEFDGILRE
jgi:hypothetical protein